MGYLYSNGKRNSKLEEFVTAGQNAGIKKSKLEDKLKDKPSLLNRLFGVLSTGETAPLAYELLESGDIGQALKEQGKASGSRVTGKGIGDYKTYEDVLADQLGMKRNIGTKAAGLGLDILLDPTTYVGAGLVDEVGKGVRKVAGPAVDVARKVPVVGKGVDAASDLAKGARKLVNPKASLIDELGKADANEVYGIINKSIKKGRFGGMENMDEVAELVEQGVKEHGKDAGKKLGQMLEAGDFEDEVVQTAKKLLDDMWGKEEAAGIIKEKIENYMPHMLTDKAQDFVNKEGLGMFGIDPKLGASKKRFMEGSVSEVNKAFREKLTKAGIEPFDLFEEDLFKVLAQRGVNSQRALAMRGMVDEIGQKFGVSADEVTEIIGDTAFKDGMKWVPMPENSLRFFPTESKAGNELLAVAKNKRPYVPEVIAEELKKINKTLINDDATKKFFKVYDKLLSHWKGSVTGFFPSFHGRNLMGATFNNFIAGVTNPKRYIEARKLMKGSDETIELAGKTYKYSELWEKMQKSGAIGQGGYLEVFDDIQKNIDKVVNPKKGFVKELVTEKPMELQNLIEGEVRGALLIDRLKKGDSFEDAVKQVWKYHFDYAPEAFTPFEKNVMKRLVPFYTWTKNNVPLQLEQMYKQPGKYAGISKTLRAIEPEEKDILPDWVKENMPIGVGEKDGKSQYLYGLNLPVGDVNKLGVSKLASQLSPAIKTPLELATGKHFFFDTQLSSVDKAPQIFEQLPKPGKEAMKKLFDYNEKTGTVNPQKWHLATSAFGRTIFTTDKLTDPDMQLWLKALYATFGLKSTDLDLEKQKEYSDTETIERLGEFLKGKGITEEFKPWGTNKYYIPKEDR